MKHGITFFRDHLYFVDEYHEVILRVSTADILNSTSSNFPEHYGPENVYTTADIQFYSSSEKTKHKESETMIFQTNLATYF